MARTAAPANEHRLPSLRAAMLLYLAVLLGTAAIIVPLARNVDPQFLRFSVALFVTAGFTVVAMLITRVKFGVLLGNPPSGSSRITWIVGLLLGAAVWIPVAWLTLTIYQALTVRIGQMPPTPSSNIQVFGAFIQAAAVIPICQGLLFWAFIQSSSESVSRKWGPVLAAVLYAFYGLFSTDFGMSIIPGLIIVGLLAAFTVSMTRSAWQSMAILAGYNLGWVLLQTPLLAFAGGGSTAEFYNTFNVRWLFIMVIGAFITFILFQVIRARATLANPGALPRQQPRQFWWVPLTLSVILLVSVMAGEIILRTVNYTQPRSIPVRPVPTGSGNSTVPPVPVPPGR